MGVVDNPTESGRHCGLLGNETLGVSLLLLHDNHSDCNCQVDSGFASLGMWNHGFHGWLRKQEGGVDLVALFEGGLNGVKNCSTQHLGDFS